MENHPSDVEAGVNMHDFACDSACIVTYQHDGCPTDLTGFNPSSKRGFAGDLIQQLVKMLDTRGGPCLDRAGR